MKPAALFGALALVPAMVGPLQAGPSSMASFTALPVALCSGGTASIPVPGREAPPGPPQGPCCAKGCHSDSKRRRA